jgi:plastocyanin
MMLATRVATFLAAISAAACGSSGTNYSGVVTPPPAGGRTVTATASLAFTPASLTLTAGDTARFTFESVGHNVFFDAQGGTPADIQGSNANTTITRVFATKGSYHYTCHIHPSMSGTVVAE